MNSTLRAQAYAALPDGNDLPGDIQIFPPGPAVEFTLQDYPGEKFTMRVDAAVAAKAQADLVKLQAAAASNKGAKPFADKNHEDSEATFHPQRIYWAGDDPRTGGVRVVTSWTGFGAALVKARAMSYFSANFLFNKVAGGVGTFLGFINENIGGLVNRPGFASMQAFAKAGDTHIDEQLDLKTESHRINEKFGIKVPLASSSPLIDAAVQLAEKNGTWLMGELNRLALLEPELMAHMQFVETGVDPENARQLKEEIAALQAAANSKITADKIAGKARAHQASGLEFDKAWSLATREVMAGK